MIPKPPGMSQKDYDRRVFLARESHRIYMTMLDMLMTEIALIPDEGDRSHVYTFTVTMLTDDFASAFGGVEKLMAEVRLARKFRKSFNKAQKS